MYSVNIVSRCGNWAFKSSQVQNHTKQWPSTQMSSFSSSHLVPSMTLLLWRQQNLSPFGMQFSSHLVGAFVYGTHLHKNKLYSYSILQQVTKTCKKTRRSNIHTLHCHIKKHLLFILVNQILTHLLQILQLVRHRQHNIRGMQPEF